ncbi:MAG: acetate kinase [Clostridiaceae bacterium]|nr:acetate kinase [Clostridiaceae bacterium]
MLILVINAGSSSLKFQLLDSENGDVKAKGLCERIGIDGSMTYQGSGDKVRSQKDMPTHREAIKYVLEELTSEKHGVIASMSEIGAVGHRVVHGGEQFAQSALITPEVKDAIRDCIPLAPLHNPANIMGIEACEEVMSNTPMVAVFDTAFHQTMPARAYMYALPYEYYKDYAVRRYGFHGTSHRFVSLEAAKFLGKPVEELKIVSCHLGNGSSITAIDGGKSIDTSMGMTPLAGVPMGTRCGDIDPAIIKYLLETDPELTIRKLDHVMNKQSGVLGVSGVSSDFRDLTEAYEQGNKRAELALDMFSYNVRKYIGAYATAMAGIDVIIFTAGVGENDSKVRHHVCKGLGYLGITIDPEQNSKRGELVEITTPDSKVKVLVVPTNEELMIAKEAAMVL